MGKVKVAVVGAGRLGGFHAEKIASGKKSILAGIYDTDRDAAQRTARKHNVPAFESVDDLLSAADAVTIAAPTAEHGRLGLLFLERGKHVLLEKPLAATAPEAETLRRKAAEKGLVLMTGHTERFNPAWRAVLPTIERMDAPAIFDARRVSPYPFRCTDVGVVLDVMIHDLELVLSVCRAPVAAVSATAFEEFGGYEDTCSAQVRFENGSAASFFASRAERTAARAMSVYSRGKRVFLDFAQRRAETVSTGSEILGGAYAPEKIVYREIQPFIPDFAKEHYSTEIFEESPIDPLQEEENLFAELILNGETAPRDFGAEAVALAERILTACRRDRAR